MKTYAGVFISPGNDKLGDIPNVSLSPLLSCKPGVPCGKGCYAKKLCKAWRSVAHAWTRNYLLATEEPEQFFNGIESYLDKKKPGFFRVHVGGDFVNQDYLNRWMTTIGLHPETRFLCFTKRDDLVFPDTIPDNLSVLASMWPGFANTMPDRFPRAWLIDPVNIDRRVPANVTICSGNCVNCLTCWTERKDIAFHAH